MKAACALAAVCARGLGRCSCVFAHTHTRSPADFDAMYAPTSDGALEIFFFVFVSHLYLLNPHPHAHPHLVFLCVSQEKRLEGQLVQQQKQQLQDRQTLESVQAEWASTRRTMSEQVTRIARFETSLRQV